MAEQIVKGHMAIPHVGGSRIQDINTLLDAAGEKAAFIFQAPKTGTVAKVGFRTRTVTTGDTVDVRLETVSTANGDPTGTLLGANSNGAQVIADGDDGTWFLTALTTPVAVTKGDIIAVVIVNGGGGGDLNIGHTTRWTVNFPYVDDFVGGAWTKDDEAPGCALEYNDGSYAHSPGVFPVSDISLTVNFNNTSDPDHRGLKFKLPFPFRIIGMWFSGDLDGNADIKLYDSDGTTVLETISLDSDIRYGTAGDFTLIWFAGAYSLAKDVFYRVVLEPTSATGVDLDEFDVDAAAIMDSFPGGQNFHYTEKKDAGWTDTTTKRPFMGILLDGLDDGAGAGGGAPNLFGGLFGKA